MSGVYYYQGLPFYVFDVCDTIISEYFNVTHMCLSGDGDKSLFFEIKNVQLEIPM